MTKDKGKKDSKGEDRDVAGSDATVVLPTSVAKPESATTSDEMSSDDATQIDAGSLSAPGPAIDSSSGPVSANPSDMAPTRVVSIPEETPVTDADLAPTRLVSENEVDLTAPTVPTKKRDADSSSEESKTEEPPPPLEDSDATRILAPRKDLPSPPRRAAAANAAHRVVEKALEHLSADKLRAAGSRLREHAPTLDGKTAVRSFNKLAEMADDLTQIIGWKAGEKSPGQQKESRNEDDSPATVALFTSRFDPPVGWFVIVDGPGRGQTCEIHYGQNSVGTRPGQRICLNFGDADIQAVDHAMVFFDERKQRFYIRPNDPTISITVNSRPIEQPTELNDFDRIKLGSTTLLFVPLCRDGFDWHSSEDDD